MFGRRKKAGRRILFGLSLMIMTTGIVAYASQKGDMYAFDAQLQAGGNIQDSPSLVKYNHNRTARVDFKSCVNGGQTPVWYQLRDAETGAEASDLYALNGTGERDVAYRGLSERYGRGYFIRVQTDSAASVGAMVKVEWEP